MLTTFYKYLEWEDLPVKNFSVIGHGHFDSAIQELKISRDHNLELKIEANGKIDNINDTRRPLGRKKSNTTQAKIYHSSQLPIIKIKYGSDITGEISGAVITSKIEQCTNEGRLIIQKARPDKVTIRYRDSQQRKIYWLTEWLINVKTDCFFPHSTDKTTDLAITISRCGQSINKNSKISFGGSFDHIELKLNDFQAKVTFGKISEKIPEQHGVLPGFISYQIIDDNIPMENYRKKIINSLSFAFGRPISSLGYTLYDENWEIIEICAVNPKLPFDNNKKCFSGLSFPPSQLAKSKNIKQNPYQIDDNVLSKIINGFVQNYEKYNLEYRMWQYWHAFFAALDIRPLLFYAIIEGIASIFTQERDNGGNILSEEIWQPIQKELLNSFMNIKNRQSNDLSNEDKDGLGIMENIIISNLNRCSSAKSVKYLLEKNQLNIGELEKTAIASRNKPAHGMLEKDVIKVIENSRILQILCNRILLKITDGNDEYIDYHVRKENGLPFSKNISQAIEDTPNS